ncbi:hypothetical protein G6K98_31840 [Agrobacterium rhizogenes]|jgi:hypothetical protein|nr:hypothetical protein [Rhizobium rhizogenes]NTH62116.1 hypothetical protein [Rhizobium rhizogenes]NTH93742.1 hypothetical protein [Rhizobium rhizogenes]
MIAEHENDVSTFKAKASESARPVSELANKTLPVLKKHRQLAQSLNH